MGYAPKSVTLATVEWKNGVAEDPGWGTAARPATLTDRLPEKVSDAEKKAYDQYRQAYERFWRQFFDPISIRVDSKPEQVTETTVFILPLINSSIYDQIRDFFPARPHAKPGSRPTVTPSPIGMMSLTLSEEKWIDFLEVASNMIERRMGIHLPIWEQLGPGIHVGVADSDSVITLGSGELLEIFGGRSNMRGNEMLLVPLIGSIFTRPVVIAMDLKDANATREALQGIPTGTLMDDRGFLGMKLNLVEITGRDRWLIRLEMEDLLFITLSMEVQDDFLVFSNLPLTYQPRVTGSEPLPMRDANIRLNPDALDKTGPGFAASALDAARKQAMAGLGILKVYDMAGVSSLEEALTHSREHFGYSPVHPSPGEFIWTERGPESSVFGPLYTGEQPPLETVDVKGLMPQTDQVDVSMQLEDDGLRTQIQWKSKESQPDE